MEKNKHEQQLRNWFARKERSTLRAYKRRLEQYANIGNWETAATCLYLLHRQFYFSLRRWRKFRHIRRSVSTANSAPTQLRSNEFSRETFFLFSFFLKRARWPSGRYRYICVYREGQQTFGKFKKRGNFFLSCIRASNALLNCMRDESNVDCRKLI